MKINLLDAHDRLKHFKEQADYISKGCQDCINNRPEALKNYPFYIFSHARTLEDGINKKIIWQPRIVKPKAETNSMLFRSYPNTDSIKIIWMIPDRALWGQYEKGKLTESDIISTSIRDFQYNRRKLEADEEDELSDELQLHLMKEIGKEAEFKKRIKSISDEA